MIKKYLLAVLLLQLLLACSNQDMPKPDYDYVKIMTLRDIYPGDAYNKGQGIWSYFYYNPNTDSVLLRKGQSISDDSAEFTTYEGQFENRRYTDTIAILINLLKHYKKRELCYDEVDSIYGAYCGPEFSVEYSINSQSHFISFAISKDTLQKFVPFYSRLSRMSWDKNIVPNSRINETEEVVHMLKGLGSYDSLVYTPPYIQPPCEKGIKMELLYGKWRTIGYINRKGKPVYTTNTVSKDGNWKIERLRDDELKQLYSGRIVSVDKDYTIKVKSDKGTTTLKVLNLTENCFEYLPKGADSNQIWRLYRMNE